MNISNPQSWYDLPLMDPMDPRSVVSFVQLADNAGAMHNGVYLNSSTFLNNTTWHPTPLSLTAIASAPPICLPVSGADYEGVALAQNWTASHGIISANTQLPATVLRTIFIKATSRYMTNIFLDWAGGVTSTDIQLSFKDNSVVGGNLITGSSTVPVFSFTGATFGSTGRLFQISTIGPGRVSMVMRVIDNSGNWSMFEMDWNIIP